jgi:hypothetical protein
MVSTKNKTKSVNQKRTNSTPTKQVVLLEEDEEDAGLSKGIIRSRGEFPHSTLFLSITYRCTEANEKRIPRNRKKRR